VALVGWGVGWALAHDGSSDSGSGPTPTPTLPAQIASEAPTDGEPVSVFVDSVGRNLLGVTDDWELFGRGPDVLVRIELAAGRVTRTAVPRLDSTGPMSFIVGPDRVVVQPFDYVAGYEVVDGLPPRSLPSALRHGGPALPGPHPGTVWAWRSPASAMRLVRILGGTTGTTVRLPSDSWATSDGGGYVLASTPDAVWWARPGSLTRISEGTLLAVGPTGWLLRECGDSGCNTVVIDRRSGTRSVLPGPAMGAGVPVGVMAPDGSVAALFHIGASTAATITLLDLHTGARRQVQVPVSAASFDSVAVWSPDSRWLFVSEADRGLAVVDGATGEVRDLGVPLPPIEQLAVRTR
jgi:hypothetical protein